jgi:hypothetical protein
MLPQNAACRDWLQSRSVTMVSENTEMLRSNVLAEPSFKEI